jgi:hypothetical protein
VGSSSWLDLDVRGRTLFAALYLAVQAGLVLSSRSRPDGVFSFQMFNESSTISIHLSRRMTTPSGEVTVPTNGKWEEKSETGGHKLFSWNDRVADPMLGTLDREVHAAYGVDAQLYRLQRAMDDFVRSLPQGTETRSLVADIQVRRNGREPFVRHLESVRRTE